MNMVTLGTYWYTSVFSLAISIEEKNTGEICKSAHCRWKMLWNKEQDCGKDRNNFFSVKFGFGHGNQTIFAFQIWTAIKGGAATWPANFWASRLEFKEKECSNAEWKLCIYCLIVAILSTVMSDGSFASFSTILEDFFVVILKTNYLRPFWTHDKSMIRWRRNEDRFHRSSCVLVTFQASWLIPDIFHPFSRACFSGDVFAFHRCYSYSVSNYNIQLLISCIASHQ